VLLDILEAKKLAEQWRGQLELYSYQYYVLNDPQVTDFEFDKLMHQLMDLENQFPELHPCRLPEM